MIRLNMGEHEQNVLKQFEADLQATFKEDGPDQRRSSLQQFFGPWNDVIKPYTGLEFRYQAFTTRGLEVRQWYQALKEKVSGDSVRLPEMLFADHIYLYNERSENRYPFLTLFFHQSDQNFTIRRGFDDEIGSSDTGHLTIEKPLNDVDSVGQALTDFMFRDETKNYLINLGRVERQYD